METLVISGKKISEEYRKKLSLKASSFARKTGRLAHLAVIAATKDEASLAYLKGKKKACEQTGISYTDYYFENKDSSLKDKIPEVIDRLNKDEDTDGILVQLPLSDREIEESVINKISPDKDVDGFTFINTGKLYSGVLNSNSLVPCTPKGILYLLDYSNIDLQSKKVCVIGRSNIVGKPLAGLLIQKNRNATVTLCNSFTKRLGNEISAADIVICAAGVPHLVKGKDLKEGAVVVDVGITRVECDNKQGYKLCGDVDFDSCLGKAQAITPVPGGVGPMTITMLLENTLIAACINKGLDYSLL